MLLLDDAASHDQVLPLLPGTAGCLAAPMRLLDHLHCAPNNPFGHGIGGLRSGKIADHIGGTARVIPGKIQLHSVRRSVRCHGEPGARKRRLSTTFGGA